MSQIQAVTLPAHALPVNLSADKQAKVSEVDTPYKQLWKSGSPDKAVLRKRPDIEELGFEIGKKLGHIGNLDVDIFEVEDKFYLLEMNPRFGGGYPFSHMAGADYPAAILSWLQGLDFHFSGCRKTFDQAFAKCDILIGVG